MALITQPESIFADDGTKVRVRPTPEYSRFVLETSKATKFKYFLLKEPNRLVIDITGLKITPTLENINEEIYENDPIIKEARSAQYKKNIVRIVLVLKQEVQPKDFILSPMADFGYRIVIDSYPKNKADPIAKLLEKEDVSNTKDNIINKEKTKNKKEGTTKKSGKIVIAIDAGHGGEDPGAIGPRGTKEKDITIAIAKKLKKLLDKEKDFKGVLIRTGDYYIPLRKRGQKAQKLKADLFVSIHADAFIKARARGSSVYVVSDKGASSAEARWLASKENASDLIGGVSRRDIEDEHVAEILADLQKQGVMAQSIDAAKVMLKQISTINRLHKKTVGKAGFVVLKNLTMPSVLVETAFLTNPREEKQLRNARYQQKMARAILSGIKQHVRENITYYRQRMTDD